MKVLTTKLVDRILSSTAPAPASLPVVSDITFEPIIVKAFQPLVDLVGPVNARIFMYMGQRRQGDVVVALYKNSCTRRYLNVDVLSLETFKYDPETDRYHMIPQLEAIKWANS